ncbi:MAG: hypothetical protein ABS49_06675 [Erythrobacter sp. SCN 62-14]|nr:MAG: hypothetical protein ABS49_06675 [Erythrobacter sp. SCN 62-14]
MKFVKPLLTAAAVLLPALPARAADEDTAVWNAQFIKFYADKDHKIFVRLESQQRLTNDVSKLGQFILRPYVAYQVNDNLQIGGGYAYFRSESGLVEGGFVFEHRAFIEVNYRVLDRPGLKVDTRTLLESRQYENIPDQIIRGRFLAQGLIPITERGTGILIFSEYLHNLNGSLNFDAGTEQLRNFGGVVIPVTRNVDVMTGYMNQYSLNSGREDTMNHVFWLKTTAKF